MTKQNIKNSKNSEKAAALLALHADKGGVFGRCLRPEEMAALVDNSCTKEERETFMHHLSCCQKCYEEWLALTPLTDHKTRKAPVYHLSKVKKYSFVGSALAVAASIVVFLNISQPPSLLMDKPSEKVSLMQSVNEAMVPQIEKKTEPVTEPVKDEKPVLKKMAKPVYRAPVVEALRRKERLDQSDVPTDVEDEIGRQGDRQVNEVSALAVQSATSARPEAASDQVSPRFAKNNGSREMVGAGDAFMDIDSWLEQLRENCHSDRQDVDYWSGMYLLGTKILENQASSLPKETREKVSSALLLLNKMKTQSVTEQCRQLLVLLAQDEESR